MQGNAGNNFVVVFSSFLSTFSTTAAPQTIYYSALSIMKSPNVLHPEHKYLNHMLF